MKTIEKGQLVTTFVDTIGGPMRVVGEVMMVIAQVKDGHGFVRQIGIDGLAAADTNEQRLYWMDRALRAEERVSNWEKTNAAESASKKDPN